jgi:hypothetical protein
LYLGNAILNDFINPNIFDLLFEKIGLNIKRDHRYIWSANHCPIK